MAGFIIVILMSLLIIGCGVKGRPLPPDTPSEIGIGRPVFKGVDQELNGSVKKNSEEDENSSRKKKSGE